MKFLEKFGLVAFYFFISLINSYSFSKLRKKVDLNLDKQIVEKEKNLQLHSYTQDVTNPILKKILEKTYRHNNIEIPKKNQEDNMKISYMLFRITILYLQFFVIISILSFQKWYEDLIKIIMFSVDQKFSRVNDLTQDKNKNLPIENFEGEYVFASGETQIEHCAIDPLFNFNYSKSFAAIYRIVEYFDTLEKKWVRLGKFNHREESILDEVNHPQIQEPSNDKKIIQINMGGFIYTFPKIISSFTCGNVKLQGISLSHEQLRRLTKYEKIDFPKNFKLQFDLEGYTECNYEYFCII